MKKHHITASLTALSTAAVMICSPLLTIAAEAYPFNTTCSYYYDQFDENARHLYDDLLLAVQAVDLSDADYESVPQVMYSGLSSDQLRDTVYMFAYDHPEYFWLQNSYQYGYGWTGNYVQLDIYPVYQNGEARQEARSRIIEIEQSYIDGALEFDTDYERADYLTKQLQEDISYQKGDLDQSLASAFLQKKTVCAGYTKAYSLLANAVGIDTITLFGVNHGWNATKIAGQWYHNDVTNSLFLYCDDEMEHFDVYATHYTVTDNDGTETRYDMHDLFYYYYTDIFPDLSAAYDGSSSVIEDTPVTTEPAATETVPPKTTTTQPTEPQETTTTATQTTEPQENTTTATQTIEPQETTTTAAAMTTTDSEPGTIHREYYEADPVQRYFFAEDVTPIAPASLIETLWHVECEETGTSTNTTKNEIRDLSGLTLEAGWTTPAEIFAKRIDGETYYHGAVFASYLDSRLTLGNVWVVPRGDFDLNGVTNAADAAGVLMYAASVGSGADGILPVGVNQPLALFAGKITDDTDTSPNASDASEILILAAMRGADQ